MAVKIYWNDPDVILCENRFLLYKSMKKKT